jgi:hypothetical protein
MTKIIKRIPGYSNKDMVKWIERLLKVMSKTKQVKVGRGKKAVTKNVFVYNDPYNDDIRKNLKQNIKHYEV